MRTAVLVLLLTRMAVAGDPPAGAVIIPIDLRKSVVRVVAKSEHTPPDSLRVAVGFSQHLMKRPEPPPAPMDDPHTMVVHKDEAMVGAIEAVNAMAVDYTTVADKLPATSELHGVFEAGIEGTVVGVWIKRAKRGDQAIVEIRPMYVLPSGAKQQLTAAAGMKHLRRSHALLAQAQAAKEAAPKLRQAIAAAEADYEAAVRESQRQNGGQTLRQYAGNVPNTAALANAALSRGRNYSRQLARAEQLTAALPAIGADAAATRKVAEYSALIAKDATIWVLIADGNKPLKVDVR